MKLSKIFKRAKSQEILPADIEAQATIEGISQTETPSTAQAGDVISITYGTGMPIDVIYGFINHDYEQEGYQDALINSNAEFCTAKENIILNQLQQLFGRVLLRYRGEIRDIEVQISNARSLFALTSATLLEARKETCEEHIAEINRMIDKLNAKAPEMLTMIESYRRGFIKGCAAQTANFLNPNKITV